MMAAAVAAWPGDLDARYSAPSNTRITNAATLPAPLAVVYVPFSRLPAYHYALSDDILNLLVVESIVEAPNATDSPAPGPPLRLLSLIAKTWEEPPSPPVQRLRSFVPILTTVSAPPIQGPHSPIAWIIPQWADVVMPPRTLPSASWVISVLPVYTPPGVSVPAAVRDAWTPVPNVPPRPVMAVPPTPTIPAPPMSVVQRAWTALTSWPADLEPRLGRPNNQQQKIAPLTLTYGTSPQPRGFLSALVLRLLTGEWPLDYPPRMGPIVSAPALPPPPPPPAVEPRDIRVRSARGNTPSVRSARANTRSVRSSKGMPTAHKDFTGPEGFWVGEDVLITSTLDPVENIAGWTIEATFRDDIGGTVLLAITGTVTDAVGAVYTLAIPKASNELLGEGTFIYAARRVDAGSYALLLEGKMQLKASAAE